jgi:hypothetical protein
MVYVIFKNKLQRLINIPKFFGTCLKCNNRIGNVIVKVLSSNVIERGFESLSGLKSTKLVFAASPLSTQLYIVRLKICQHGNQNNVSE